MIRQTRKKLTPLLLTATFLAFGACASVENDPPALGDEAQVGPGDAEVEVSIENNDITLEPSQVESGTVVFHVFNNGTVNHDFEIRSADGELVDEELKFTLDPDNREDLEINLGPGVYTVLCTIGDHQDSGERALLRVG